MPCKWLKTIIDAKMQKTFFFEAGRVCNICKEVRGLNFRFQLELRCHFIQRKCWYILVSGRGLFENLNILVGLDGRLYYGKDLEEISVVTYLSATASSLREQ